jgi:GTP cyclohydrolase I
MTINNINSIPKQHKALPALLSKFNHIVNRNVNVGEESAIKRNKLKIETIENHFRQIMLALGLDLNDDSLKDTPNRVAEMFVKEIFSGLDEANKPEITLFENKYRYGEMLIEKNISLYSYCEHHFVPIIGKVHVGYISNGKVIGLSKINRVVQYYAKRPQVQERLTMQIAEGLKEALDTQHLAVIIDALHLCVASRGVNDTNCSTLTSYYSGDFKGESKKQEFIALALSK